MHVFNSLTVDGRTYSQADVKRAFSIKQYGIPDWFYGGRVRYIGTTDTDVLLLMSNPNTVIDTGAEKLDGLPIELIQKICDSKKIKYHHKLGKEKLIRLLEGENIAEENN